MINDLFSFAQANYLDNSLAFEFSKYLSNEIDYLPWKTFLMKIRYFINVLESTPSYGNLQAFLASLVQPYYQKLGWIENIHTDEWNDRNLRKKIVSFSCDRDVLDCVNTARTYFDSWSSDLDIQKCFIFPKNYLFYGLFIICNPKNSIKSEIRSHVHVD